MKYTFTRDGSYIEFSEAGTTWAGLLANEMRAILSKLNQKEQIECVQGVMKEKPKEIIVS